MTESSHKRNPLAGRNGYTHLLLRELSDDEVADYCDYWTTRHEEYRAEGNGYAAWQASKRLSSGHREARRRGLGLERRVLVQR